LYKKQQVSVVPNTAHVYRLHAAMKHWTDHKTGLRLSVYLCIGLWALSQLHFLIDFHQN